MRKSATAPVLNKSVNLNFEEEEHNSFLRILSDLRREAKTTIKILEINQKSEISNEKQDKVLLYSVLKIIEEDYENVVRYSTEIAMIVKDYDFKDVKANGYRSFLLIIQRCSVHLVNHIRTINTQKNILQWNSSLVNEIIAFSECFHELALCFYFMSEMKRLSNGHNLFPVSELINEEEFQALIDKSDDLKQEKFLGQCLGFYYCSSAQRILQVLASIMSGCAHSFLTNRSGIRGMFNTVLQSVSCFWNPQNRGHLMSAITRNATIEFTKQFWNLGEHPLVLEAPNMILPPVEVAVNFKLPPVPFTVLIKNSDMSKSSNVTVYPPTAKAGQNTTPNIKLRLISLQFREGLNWIDCKSSNEFVTNESSFIKGLRVKVRHFKERSNKLLIHCHGGGFVAQSAKSHDTYLRLWTEQLDCPILSIDYSLAPEFPYPRALEECFYAISWAIRNRRQLGCTSDAKVVLCGDSAGANLALCSTLKLIRCGITVPDALFLAYVPVLVAMTPSPARLLASIDPLLPVGVLARCLLAYVGINEKKIVSDVDSTKSQTSNLSGSSSVQPSQDPKNQTNDLMDLIENTKHKPSSLSKVRSAQIPKDPFLSPLLADDVTLSGLPPVSVIGTHFDPLLDDCVELCKRLDSLGVPVSFRVMNDIPHGFLNFVLLSRECENASHECIKMIGQLFENSFSKDG